MLCAGNTDAMQLLGGLLSVLPERVSKTMQAHKDVLLKRVSASRGDMHCAASVPSGATHTDSKAAIQAAACCSLGHA